MQGTKIRTFAPLPNHSLEELVPKDNFQRRLEEKLDLSFVRESVRYCYTPTLSHALIPLSFREALRLGDSLTCSGIFNLQRQHTWLIRSGSCIVLELPLCIR